MNIFVDIDGVCADLSAEWLRRYNEDYNDNLKDTDLVSWEMEAKVKPECGKKIYDYLLDPNIYNFVDPVPGALEGVNKLRMDGHRVIFATATPYPTNGRKLRWLQDHDFLSYENDYVELKDKSLLSGDLLIDDGPHNVKAFKGASILYRRPHNTYFKWGLTAYDWCEVYDIVSQNNFPIGNHPTELRCPVQTRAFKEILDKMYRVHLEKNADYSPANILGTGEIGLTTRLWDKIARLMNLTGFNIKVELLNFEKPKVPKNESIDDSYQDLSVYGIIAMLYRQGKWGH